MALLLRRSLLTADVRTPKWVGQPVRKGLEAIIDITMGTIDRECLEKEYMVPQGELNIGLGIPWFTRATMNGFEGKRCDGMVMS